jgi:chemotaxis protein histidine kinase CheA
MVLPLIPLIVAAATAASATVAAKKGYDSYQNIKEAKEIAEATERKYKKAFNSFEQARKRTNEMFESYGETKLTILNGTMKHFVKSFKKLKNVQFSDKTVIDSIGNVSNIDHFMKEVEKQTIHASQIAVSGISALAGGGLAAMGALGATTTFAAASTGTAIASLSGAAATNATLAFLGGGSLAAGGLGVAGGMVVLGGIALAPALAIGSVIFASSTEKKLEEIKKQRAEINVEIKKLDAARNVLNEIQTYTSKMQQLARNCNTLFKKYIDRMEKIISLSGTNYLKLSFEEQQVVYDTYQLAVVMKHLLDTSIINEDGAVSSLLDETIVKTEKYLSKSDRGFGE